MDVHQVLRHVVDGEISFDEAVTKLKEANFASVLDTDTSVWSRYGLHWFPPWIDLTVIETP
jgi:hypothetical protein